MKKIISALLTIAFILALPLNIFAATPSLSVDTERENLARSGTTITYRTCPRCSNRSSFRWYCNNTRDYHADPEGGNCYVPSHGEGCAVVNKIKYITYGVCMSCYAGDPTHYVYGYEYPYECWDDSIMSYVNHSETCNHIYTGDTVYDVCVYYDSVYDVLGT